MVMPHQGQEMVLQDLHEGHPGMTRMKSLAIGCTCGGQESTRKWRNAYAPVVSAKLISLHLLGQ